MQRKSSRGTFVVGSWLVTWNTLILAQGFFPVRKFTRTLFDLYYAPLQLVWLISTVILVGFVVGSFELLKLKEFGRSLVIFIAVIDIPHLIVGKAIFNNYGIQPMYIRNFFLIPVSVVLDFAIVYFLHRPDVRKQFS
ncbi:MAG: hypothetical protein JW869_02120 [Candidatus Omnitrophica bacterium]|nr:hypothetical protein [Candidatus Omnitrophota bacterium]